MSKQSLSEQLDQEVEAIRANPDAPIRTGDARMEPLLRLAAALCELPSQDFRRNLKAQLERRASMPSLADKVEPVSSEIATAGATPSPQAVPETSQTITPYLTVHEAEELIDFVKEAFGAQELLRGKGSAGGTHAEVRIGDSTVMIGGGGTWRGTPMPTSLHLYVKDADALYRRAISAGATSLYEPTDQEYGDREAGVRDRSGNNWYIATHKETGHAPEGLRSVTPYLQARGAAQLMDFVKRAFGAEETERYASPDGTVVHAKVRIGNSALEMGEAHGAFPPMPTKLYLSVPDVDAVYAQALAAGADSLGEPADQPHGARVGGVTDPFGNVWYIATPQRGGA